MSLFDWDNPQHLAHYSRRRPADALPVDLFCRACALPRQWCECKRPAQVPA